MLGVKAYTAQYIRICRAKVDSDLAAYREFAPGASATAPFTSVFEAAFFNNMVIILDAMFVHRLWRVRTGTRSTR